MTKVEELRERLTFFFRLMELHGSVTVTETENPNRFDIQVGEKKFFGIFPSESKTIFSVVFCDEEEYQEYLMFYTSNWLPNKFIIQINNSTIQATYLIDEDEYKKGDIVYQHFVASAGRQVYDTIEHPKYTSKTVDLWNLTH